MAFDLAWGFRGTAIYVTDPSYQVPCLGEAYPHTYTNGDGYSINAGWVTGPDNSFDRNSGNDPRLAGIALYANQPFNANPSIFSLDLSSGSAPGAGAYTVDLAVGDAHPEGGATNFFQLKDDTTVLIDGSAGFTISGGQFIDATLATITASTTWTGTTASKTFASTTVNLNTGGFTGGVFTRIAHFRLTLQEGEPSGLSIPVAMHSYCQRRN